MGDGGAKWVAEVRAAAVQLWALVLIGSGLAQGALPWAWGLAAIVAVAAPTTSVRDLARLASSLAGIAAPKDKGKE